MGQYNREASCFSMYTSWCISGSSSAHPSLGVPKDTELETAMETEAVTELVPSRPWGKCRERQRPSEAWRRGQSGRDGKVWRSACLSDFSV